MKIEYNFVLKGSSIRHTGELAVKKDNTYTFSKASEALHNHISTKYGWSSEQIIELNMKLIY